MKTPILAPWEGSRFSSGHEWGTAFLLFAALLAAPWRGAAQWVPLTNGAPSARAYGPMAEDTARARMVLFGGTPDGAAALDDTWEWASINGPWQQVGLGVPRPPARLAHGTAYWSNATNGHILIFGGQGNSGALLGDTWSWAGSNWLARSNSGPSARLLLAMAAEPTRQRVLLFGGYDNINPLGDTWTWNGSNWSQLPVAGPPARAGHAMAYDSVRDRVVLFGGQSTFGYLNDTWEWDGTSWALKSTNGPSIRRDHALARRGNRIVLYGGVDPAGTPLADTWEWDGTNWSLTADGCPTARFAHAIATQAATSTPLMYGGAGAVVTFDDTLRYLGRIITADPTNVTVNAGQTASFTITASTNGGTPAYQWERNCGTTYQTISGANAATYTIANASTNDACLYRCRVQLLSCIATSLAAQLSVSGTCAPPVITLQPTNQTVDLCSCATFTVGATGTPPLSYQWLRNGANLAGATGSSFTLCPVTLADNGALFKVLITNACGSVVSAGATLTVADVTPPTLNCPTNDIVVNAGAGGGSNVVFNVTATDCDTNVSIVCFPPSGAFFPCGTNRVTCTATDSSSNHSTCSFNVVVVCGCLALATEQINCTNGPSLLNYSFTFQNNSGVPVKYLLLVPNTNCFSFVPDVLSFKPPVLPGQATNVSVTINIAGACSSNLCFLVAALDTNSVQCCAISHCVSSSCVSTRPKLTIVLSGGVITLSWTGSGILQSATSLAGPWADAANQSNPQSFPPTGAQKFFRLRQ